ncbi:succinate dehydrogenase [ubiquinone] cytochrome b small subunit, mitochondrial-like [Oppia nitens]|uniref:succinate dehydrogenase [ubiquinone] cytochrome b small subunit, mitochondrial-like n=1 Tax=Oppia nitens TaxID=1686743 RepID=UPI0023DA5B97|nr:succinate dehydrogenase [ubiquinone] cytochrome b small subunit, mitochondrial-like [Oppia nitens]
MNSLSMLRFVSKSAIIARPLSMCRINAYQYSPKIVANSLWTQTNANGLTDDKNLKSLSNNQLISSRLASSSSSTVEQSGGHNHSKLWTFERYLSAGLLAVIPAAIAVPNPALDYLLALSVVTHIHWGLEAVVVDYIRPSIFGKVIPKLAVAYLYGLSIAALVGLLYFNYTDVGLGVAIRLAAKL